MAAITSAASGNWSATGTWTGGVVPGEGDTVTIQNGHTVTINQNITVGADSATPAIQMSGTGKLVLPSSPAADYTLICKGDLNTGGGGFEIASAGTPLDSARKFTIKLNYSATPSANEFRMNSNLTKFYGRAYATSYRTTLTAQAASAQNVINVADATGWAVGDELVIGTTTTTKTQTEAKVIQAIAGNQVTLTTNLSSTHDAGGPVVHLTRNILITNNNDTYGTNVSVGSGLGNSIFQYVRFKNLKGNTGHWSYNSAVSNFYGNNAGATMLGCVLDGGTPAAVQGGNEPQWDIQKTVVYNHSGGIYCEGPSTTNQNHKDNVVLNCTGGSGYACRTGDNGRTWEQNLEFSGNWIVACGSASTDYGAQVGGVSYGWAIVKNNWIYAQTGIGLVVNACELLTDITGNTIWGCSTYGLKVDRSWSAHFDNNKLGDPTGNTSGDILISGREQSFLKGTYTKLNSTTKVVFDTANMATAPQEFYHVGITNVGQVQDRHRTDYRYGKVCDHLTGGQAAGWANGGSGLALLMDPGSTTNGIRWEFYVPVTASTPVTLKAYVRATAGTPTLTCTIYDSKDDVTKLLDAQAVTLTTSWAQYAATQVTPTYTGFCRVVFEAKDGGVTGDIGIDDVSVA